MYLYLLKTDTTLGIDLEAVRTFLTNSRKQEDRKILEARKRKKRKDYDKEMKEFLSLRQAVADKKVQDMEDEEGDKNVTDEMKEKEEEETEEFIDIGKNPFSKIIGSLASKNAQKERYLAASLLPQIIF